MTKNMVKKAAGTVGWVVIMTCPHASFLVSQLNQFTTFDEQDRKLVNKSIDRPLRYGAGVTHGNNMELSTPYIASYSDASLANIVDLSSKISGLVVFRDFLGNAALSQHWSRKCQRVTQSTLSGEAIALTTVFESAFILRNAVSEIFGLRVPLFVFADSYSLFQVMAKSKLFR